MRTNITKVLKSNMYQNFLRMAEKQTNFNKLPERKKRQRNPFYTKPTPNLHQVAKSPIKNNTISFVPKITPQGKGMMIGNTRVSLYTNSPPRKVRRRLISSNNNNTSKNLRGNFKKMKMNSPPRKILVKQLTPTSPLNSRALLAPGVPQGVEDNRKELKRKTGLNSYKKGGVVRKTGLARVHKGELVIPKPRVAMVRRAIRMYQRRTAKK